MSLSATLVEFLRHIAIGAGAVLVVLFVIQLGMPRRAPVGIDRRKAS